MKLMFILFAAYLLDLIFGDPHWLFHPICLIGNAISRGEKWIRLRFSKDEKGERRAGTVLAIFIVSMSFLLPLFLLMALKWIHPMISFIVEIFFCYQILATKSLRTESMKVYDALQRNDILEAQKFLSWIVGRDTENLTEAEIIKATVETVAENTSDGVIAPMIFMAIGGAPLGFFYKAINTLDSMIGYKNDSYLYFGRFAAKLDDAANFIPARMTAFLMILSSFLAGLNGKKAFSVWKRDRRKHASPNSAQTESACAGALEIQLGGDASYFGKKTHKQFLGDAIRVPQNSDIRLANRLLYISSFLGILLFEGLRLVGVLLMA